MKTTLRNWRVGALGLLLATTLCACLVPDGAYVGGVYAPSGYEYGRWGSGYHVAPPRGGERGHYSQPAPRAYRPAPQNRPAPSIPSRPRGH